MLTAGCRQAQALHSSASIEEAGKVGLGGEYGAVARQVMHPMHGLESSLEAALSDRFVNRAQCTTVSDTARNPFTE